MSVFMRSKKIDKYEETNPYFTFFRISELNQTNYIIFNFIVF